MKRALRFSIAAIFCAGTLASPAFGQTGDGGMPDAPAQDEKVLDTEPSLDSGTTAAIQTDFDSALDLIDDRSGAAAINTITQLGKVHVIRMGALDGSDSERIDQATAASETKVAELRAALQSNPAVASQIEAQGVTASEVIAADVAADGSVVVYTR